MRTRKSIRRLELGTLKIGFFGKEGREGTRTHVVTVGGHPICGSRFGKDTLFQWCCHFIPGYTCLVECRKCVRRMEKEL